MYLFSKLTGEEKLGKIKQENLIKNFLRICSRGAGCVMFLCQCQKLIDFRFCFVDCKYFFFSQLLLICFAIPATIAPMVEKTNILSAIFPHIPEWLQDLNLLVPTIATLVVILVGMVVVCVALSRRGRDSSGQSRLRGTIVTFI